MQLLLLPSEHRPLVHSAGWFLLFCQLVLAVAVELLCWTMPIAAICDGTSGLIVNGIAIGAGVLLTVLACALCAALCWWQKLRAFPALLLVVAMLASGGSSLIHLSVLSGCAVPEVTTIVLQLMPCIVAGRWHCWKRGQLACCRWPRWFPDLQMRQHASMGAPPACGCAQLAAPKPCT